MSPNRSQFVLYILLVVFRDYLVQISQVNAWFVPSTRVSRCTNQYLERKTTSFASSDERYSKYCYYRNSVLFSVRGYETIKPPISSSILNQQEYLKVTKQSITILGSLLGAALVKSNPANAATLILPECSDSISVLKDPTGYREIVLLGTAHISEESVEQVRRTIRKIEPNTVMIELDLKRLGIVDNDKSKAVAAGFDVPPSLPSSIEKIAPELSNSGQAFSSSPSSMTRKEQKRWIEDFAGTIRSWVRKQAGNLLGSSIGQFYKSIEKLGFKAGGEFQAAVEEAKSLKTPARVLLGDRDVDETLQSLAAAILKTESDRFDILSEKLTVLQKQAGMKISEDDSMNKAMLTDFVEGLKQRDLLNQVLAVIKEEVPLIYNALIGERDVFMANSIATSQGEKLVAVVGMAHMNGIESTLKSKFKYQLIRNVC